MTTKSTAAQSTRVKFQFVTDCTQSDGPSIRAMVDAGRQVAYHAFARECDWQPLARTLGYHIGSGKGLTLRRDWHVAYYHSTYKGYECYYMKWSAIEHIFLKPTTFIAYLGQCTDAQVQWLYEQERAAGRVTYAELAIQEANRRGIVLSASE